MTPSKAIHLFCVECAGSSHLVKDCGGDHCLNGGCDKNGVCWFYPYRQGKGRPKVSTIRRMCLWCQGGRADFVRDCGDCVLSPYRMGTNPARKGIGFPQNILRERGVQNVEADSLSW